MGDSVLLFKLSSLCHGLRQPMTLLERTTWRGRYTVLSLLLTSGTCPERHRTQAWAQSSHWAAGSQETCYEKVKRTGKEPLYFLPQMKISEGWLHTSLGASFSSPFSSSGELMLIVPLEQGNRNVPYTWHIQLHRTWQTIVTRNQVQWEVRGKLHYLANYN